ncbi:MAG: hypothetical protein QF790_08665 [Gammaproteobacteria bacterium]|jgi:hypothetical protein|nr:hypothetical protein [Gammaproteobacteria bacterium]MDP6617219.1 hypothetical protein [Gammaproteobacteria bacterium]MDP6695806.1 hypothetical protein [Gammaproteobacteria bacterium]MDP7041230.1 hypothetical protein [Gammaproteobacteria bacterium]
MLYRVTGIAAVGVLLSGCLFNPFARDAQPAAEPVTEIVEIAGTRQVAVVLSNDLPEFVAIADELNRRFSKDITVHSLGGKPGNAERVLAEIDAAGADQLVAVGLLAAKIGRERQGRPMVFCQTYNYKEHGLVSANSKGVGLLPPFDKQFETWHELDPKIKRIGLLSGPDKDELLVELRQAGDRRGIGVISRAVSSDKEALLEFKRMMSNIQGLIILPDNRILSPRVLREIMSLGAKRRTQIVVYAPGLLNLGALMSFTGRPDDIANAVVKRLESVQADGRIPGPGLIPLEEIRVQVNPAMADHLSLIIPEPLAGSTGNR